VDEQDRDQQPDDDTEGHMRSRAVADEEDDTEGHNLSMNPTMADQLARTREADVQRAARGGFFRRDAKENQRRGR
jgi:hypothetical protein